MDTNYRIGQLVNVFLIGVLVGVSMLTVIRKAEGGAPPRAVRRWRAAPVQMATRGIDLAPLGCGWTPAGKAAMLGW